MEPSPNLEMRACKPAYPPKSSYNHFDRFCIEFQRSHSRPKHFGLKEFMSRASPYIVFYSAAVYSAYENIRRII